MGAREGAPSHTRRASRLHTATHSTSVRLCMPGGTKTPEVTDVSFEDSRRCNAESQHFRNCISAILARCQRELLELHPGLLCAFRPGDGASDKPRADVAPCHALLRKPPAPGGMQIFVCVDGVRNITLEVESIDTIDMVNSKIQDKMCKGGEEGSLQGRLESEPVISMDRDCVTRVRG
jgi:hypothetical protein